MSPRWKEIDRGKDLFILILENDWHFASSVLRFLRPANSPWAKHCRKILLECFVDSFGDSFSSRRSSIQWALKWLRTAASGSSAQSACEMAINTKPSTWTQRDWDRLTQGLRLLIREQTLSPQRQVELSLDLIRDIAVAIEMERETGKLRTRATDNGDVAGEELW